MLILFKHIFRNIRENKFRSVLIIISLAISTMVMFLNLTIKDDIAKKYTSVLQGAFQDYDLSVSYNNPNGDKYFSQENLDLSPVKAEQILYSLTSYGVYMKEEESLTVNFGGFDRKMLQDTNLCTLEEKSVDFDSEDDAQIIVSKKSAEIYNWKLDDEVTIFTKDGEKKLKITGVAKTAGLFLTESNNIYIMTTLNFARKCAAVEDSISQVLLDLPEGTDLEAAASQLNDANTGYITGVLVDKESIESSLTMINQLLIIILSLVIGLNFYIIASITKLIMATRIPVVGTFRSLGATKGMTNFILILENAVFGIIGAVIGIGLGILVRNPLSDLFINAGDAFDYLNVKLDFKLSYVIIAVCFSVGLQILISISSIVKASRRSIKDNIFNTLSTMAKLSKKKTCLGILLLIVSVIIYFANMRYSFLLGILALVSAIVGTVFVLPYLTKYIAILFSLIFGKLFGGPASLGMKNISSSKTIRSSITLVTVGLALILMVYGAVNSMYSMFNGYEDSAEYDVEVTGLSEQAQEYLYIEDFKGIDRISFCYYSFIEGKMKDKDAQYIVIGSDRYYAGIEGDESLLSNLLEKEILVDEYFALKNDIKIGDALTLESQDFISGTKTYQVDGFINASTFTSRRNVFIINETEYKRELGSIPATIEVYANSDSNDVKEMLIKEFAGTGITVQTLSEYLSLQKESNQSILNMVTVILGLSVILAIFGLINNQMIGFIQRKREYAVLYSVSMSRAQLRKMIFFEALGTFITGCIFAVILSQWLIKLLYVILMAIGMGYQLKLEMVSVLQIVGIVLVVLLITSISPIRKISKINVISEIKYE